jgi:hypothetical protein
MTQFRVQTDAGHMYELDAPDWIEAIHLAGYTAGHKKQTPGRISSIWYYRTDIRQWVSGDDLLFPRET